MKKTVSITFRVLLIGLLSCCLISCEKFLDTKPNQRLAVPENLDDLQALMDDYPLLIIESDAGEVSSGDFTITDADLASLSSDFHRRMYRWDDNSLFEEGSASNNWGRYYSIIYSCNTVLDALEKISRTPSNGIKYDQIKGRALFLRAQKLFQASLIWCNVYDSGTASQQLGMPIRLDTDFNKVSVRSSLEETYRQILSDAESSIDLLPENVAHPVEPGRCANYTLLARIHLYMGNYEKSFLYADSALSIKSDLMDYSAIDQSPTYPFPRFNEETVYYIQVGPPQILNLARAKIVKELVDSYHHDDLRKVLYFAENADGTHGFRGRYTGSTGLFMGYTTDELYLIRAESAARIGRIASALQDINTLLSTRWKKVDGVSTYRPMEETDRELLLESILLERRKSLLFRGLRWYDLKRLNRDGANITLRRTVGGKEYVLPPDDLRYALPIPEDVIRLSNIVQNPR